jgi:hypothetical protein
MTEMPGPRLDVLRRRLKDAQATMGCGDAPDIGGAATEIERLEEEMARLEGRSSSGEVSARAARSE